MATAILLAPLNAANFESDDASDGHVLTADGAGGASWQAPAGGGGASFAYDGATFEPGTYNANDYSRTIAVILTLGGQPVPDGMYMLVAGAKAWMYDSFFSQLDLALESPLGANGTLWRTNNTLSHLMYNKIDGGDPLVFTVSTDSDGAKTAHVFLMLPSGNIAHTTMQIPGGGT